MATALPAGVERLFGGLRPRSMASLEMGIRTMEIDGVPATLIVQIPALVSKPNEVFLSTAPSSLVAELFRFSN